MIQMKIEGILERLKSTWSDAEKHKIYSFTMFAIICVFCFYSCWKEENLELFDVEWLNDPRSVGGVSYDRILYPKLCFFEDNGRNASFCFFTVNETRPLKHGKYFVHCEGMECDEVFPLDCQSICFLFYPSSEQPTCLWIGMSTMTEDQQNQIDIYRLIDDWRTDFPECIFKIPPIFSEKYPNVENLGFSSKKQIYPEEGMPEQLLAYYLVSENGEQASMQYFALNMNDPKKIWKTEPSSWLSWDGEVSDLVFFGIPPSTTQDITDVFYRICRIKTKGEKEEMEKIVIEWSKNPVFSNKVLEPNKIKKYGDFTEFKLEKVENLSFSVSTIENGSFISLLSLERTEPSGTEEYDLSLYIMPRYDPLNSKRKIEIERKISICKQRKEKNGITISFENLGTDSSLRDYLITETSMIDTAQAYDNNIYFVMVVKNKETEQDQLIMGSFSLIRSWNYISILTLILFCISFLFSAFFLSLLLAEYKKWYDTLSIMILALGILILILSFLNYFKVLLFDNIYHYEVFHLLSSLGFCIISVGLGLILKEIKNIKKKENHNSTLTE